MFVLNAKIFFVFLFVRLILCRKTEIKFTFNVESLFRCKKNGPVFHFTTFPSDQLFNETISNSTRDCDLILMPSSDRVILDINYLLIRCSFHISSWGDYVSEVGFFKSNCTKSDRCSTSMPRSAIVARDPEEWTNSRRELQMSINGRGTENVSIGDPDQYSYAVSESRLCMIWEFVSCSKSLEHGYKTNGERRYYLSFKIDYQRNLSMMCRFVDRFSFVEGVGK